MLRLCAAHEWNECYASALHMSGMSAIRLCAAQFGLFNFLSDALSGGSTSRIVLLSCIGYIVLGSRSFVAGRSCLYHIRVAETAVFPPAPCLHLFEK